MRPDFSEIANFEEFNKYYWYKTELVEICKSLGINSIGVKTELNYNIKEYFNGNVIKSKNKIDINKVNFTDDIELNTPLLSCKFSFNQKFRDIFGKLTNQKNFKFTSDMATTWRKVKENNDINFTLGDMLNVYLNKINYAKYDNTACQWNKFYKDFCADEKNKNCKNKLKEASKQWNIVKNSDRPKIYSCDIIIENN